MNITNEYIRAKLLTKGADIVGFGDLAALPEDIREGLRTGISIAVKHPKEIIRGIADFPTLEYSQSCEALSKRLDELAEYGAQLMQAHGFSAIAMTRQRINATGYLSKDEYITKLPHKTVATRAGVGWIGKTALLTTREYGSLIRLTSILTDAPLKCATPVDESRCGSCNACVDACPAKAATGKLWRAGMPRDDIYNEQACKETMVERTMKSFGKAETHCGRCIAACPYTKRYLDCVE